MKIDYMREYIALVKNPNFTNTAEELFITQPALSRHIAFIEEEIGVQLLLRDKRKIELTAAGSLVYEEFQKIVELYDNLLKELDCYSSGVNGELRLGMLYYVIEKYFSDTVMLFKEKYPNVKLSFSSCQPYQIVEQLINDKIDLGLIMNSDFPRSKKLTFHNICSEKFVVLVSENHPFADRKSVALSELKDENFIFFQVDVELNHTIKKSLAERGIFPKKQCITEQVDTLPFTILQTDGICIMIRHMKDIQRKGIVTVDIDDTDFQVDMSFAYKTGNKNPMIQLFLELTDHLFQTK
jgi:DNA-binding transcriptional LysR family regulator